MTTNQTIEEINAELVKATNKDRNIEIESTISTSVNYLDVTITNENGQLRTMIYHKPSAQPYYLPYTSDHPHQYHRNIPYSALLRAARLCSNVNDFNQESLRINVSLLLSEYPPKLISNQFLRFFQVNNAELVLKQLDEQAYKRLHQKLLHPKAKKQKELNESTTDPVGNPRVLQKKVWDRTVMYPKYTFESGTTLQFSKQFYSWWKKNYQYAESSVKNVKVRLIPKTNHTLAQLLIHKKPQKDILTRMEPSKI
jgi:hypothetical protein